ncbi:MAG: RNA ligase family protein [Candidatus Nanoarchaeia archaeon]|jgi:hypothetical protein
MSEFIKYPSIYRLGKDEVRDLLAYNEDTIIIEEKVDGGNFSFFMENETLHECSRNRDLTQEGDEKTFIGKRVWLREHLAQLSNQGVLLNPDYLYYAECMDKHTLHYSKAPHFIGLDIRVKHSMKEEGPGLFLGVEAKTNEFKRIGIETTPIIWQGNSGELKKLDLEKLVPMSHFGEIQSEGICIKNYNRMAPGTHHQLFAKIVREEFKECNKAVFGGVHDKDTDTNKIVAEFITPARIRKESLKLINEGGLKLDLTLMSKLPSNVIKDVLKEEFNGIFERYKFIDFSLMKKLVSKVCLHELNLMLNEASKQ